MDHVQYNFEYETRLRVGFVGAGGHAWRNVYPAFRYAPIDLRAVCDLDLTRAQAFARQFGAANAYADYRQMFAAEDLDAVFIVTSYEADGEVQATRIALDALAAGLHVWMEKPTAASVASIEALMEASRRSGRIVMTGLKKLFFPTIERAKEIIQSPEFGPVTSVYVRYPQAIPRPANRSAGAKMIGLLDHIYHPAAILSWLMGPIDRFSYEWEPKAGASVAALRFASGAVGCLHFCSGMSGSSPLERLEVIGLGANLVVENGARLIYYRPAERPAYGRSASFMTPADQAPLLWEPEFSLGQLNNNTLFLLGYAQEIRHFCDCAMAGREPERGNLEQCLEIMRLFEAYRTTDAGVTVAFERAAPQPEPMAHPV